MPQNTPKRSNSKFMVPEKGMFIPGEGERFMTHKIRMNSNVVQWFLLHLHSLVAEPVKFTLLFHQLRVDWISDIPKSLVQWVIRIMTANYSSLCVRKDEISLLLAVKTQSYIWKSYVKKKLNKKIFNRAKQVIWNAKLLYYIKNRD